ncbi:hypothetical protein CLV24_108127 [Pontibacter ummariensis]|uniref:Uncharacterized protein n=1 Tax=Pontibacter ummariensis TaxID=1610492 RepID=A0A239F7T4_9BACT|nr:hypothetical protein [Pontibacter ummariensis]PRY12383.1 hypothetical protein CLV24_108127 [Pontibacter ummariensis]SNS52989.1 hypothetical protein SAMN06296052_10858 [Pontibacter ummariensis]
MKRTKTKSLLFVFGATLLALSTATCLFVYNCFNDEAFDIDTSDEDEDEEEYL